MNLLLYLDIPMVLIDQPVDAYANGGLVGRFEFAVGENMVQRPRERSPDENLEIRFRFKNLKSPLELKMSGDGRKLGIGVKSFCLVEKAD